MSFRGALVYLSTDVVAPTYPYIVSWDSESYDTDAIHAGGDPTKLTVPSGVHQVRLVASVYVSTTASPSRTMTITILKNGSASWIGTAKQNSAGTTYAVGGSVQSALINVTAGDYFEVQVDTNRTDTDVDSTISAFGMEIVDADIAPGLFTDTDAFYAPTVTRGAVSLSPGLFIDTDAFYPPTLTFGQVVTPPLYTESDAFYAPTVTRGAVTVAPSLYTESDVFYAPTVANAAAGGGVQFFFM